MLESVASGKRMPEKNLLVLGARASPGKTELGSDHASQEAPLSHNASLSRLYRTANRGVTSIDKRHPQLQTILHLVTPITMS